MCGGMTETTLAWVRETLESEGLVAESNLAGRDGDTWFGAAIDTRSECANRLFFALRGEKTDGHRFVAEAHDKGCRAAVIDDAEAGAALARSGVPFFRVRGALEALQELSRRYLRGLDARVVAVTGSMGKTTTKEYIRGALRKKYRVHTNAGNLNNHIGVPLTVLDTDADTEYLVCEIAANHTGEIDFLSRLLRPDIGVITNIGEAHIGYFGGRDKIAEAKSEIFAGVDAEGYAVLPADDDYFETLRSKAVCRVVSFGRSESATYRIAGVEEDEGRFRFEINGERMELGTVGEYNVINAGAAYAVGELCGVEPERIREALTEAEAIPGRAKVYRGKGVVLVDDSYNANPTSMRAALDSFSRLKAARRIAVLGDMGELGDFSDDAHRELGAYAARLPLDALVWYGDNALLVGEGFSRAGSGKKVRPYGNLDELVRDLKNEIRAGDAVLVKGSRACHLDKVVNGLLEAVLEEDRR
jgi:UDP-N-acetylmuramoyl-tripeptide--D-alanyl-D-alanine ligase